MPLGMRLWICDCIRSMRSGVGEIEEFTISIILWMANEKADFRFECFLFLNKLKL